MKNFWLERKQTQRDIGSGRGIRLQTASGHHIELTDNEYPHIYGFKSPSKHTIGYINEDEPACEKRWKRMEIMSSTGFLMMKSSYGTSLTMKEEDGRTEEDA